MQQMRATHPLQPLGAAARYVGWALRTAHAGRVLVALAAALLASCSKKGAAGGPADGFAVQVVAVEARRQPVIESLSLVGSILANEMVEIKSETDGTVQEILFKEGQQVEKGDWLIRLDETKFTTALDEAQSNFELTKATFERTQELLRNKLVSQQEFDQAAAMYHLNNATVERRQRELKDARIHAPFAGIMGARNISPGQVITRNTTLSWLVDLDPVKVEIAVPERFLSQLKVGQDIELSVAAFAGKKFQGKVYFIAPSVDAATRTAQVKAEIPNLNHELKPGMFASLDLTLKVRENSIVIPEIALSQVLEDDRASVFVVTDGTVQAKPVKLGVRLAGHVEVLSGLEAGEKVIVEGTQKVGPGSKVKVSAPAEPASIGS